MLHPGDKVVYANYGVCIVSANDALMSMGGKEMTYYVLLPTRERGGKVYVPLDKEEMLRPIISADEAAELVSAMGSIEIDTFHDSNSRTVEDHFKKMLRKNDCSLAIQVAKTMRARIREQEAKKHLPSSMYTRLLDQAEHQVRSEISAALGIPETEFLAYVEAHVK